MAFIAPGLHVNERGFIIKYSLWCALLFIIGVAFAFFIGFTLIINFSLTLSEVLSIEPVIGFKAYLHELIRWLLILVFYFNSPHYLWG